MKTHDKKIKTFVFVTIVGFALSALSADMDLTEYVRQNGLARSVRVDAPLSVVSGYVLDDLFDGNVNTHVLASGRTSVSVSKPGFVHYEFTAKLNR